MQNTFPPLLNLKKNLQKPNILQEYKHRTTAIGLGGQAHRVLRGYIHLLKGQKLYTISISSGVVRGKHCSYIVTVRHSYLITMQIYGAACRSMEPHAGTENHLVGVQ